jgi:plasmid stabilization system protein ParE
VNRRVQTAKPASEELIAAIRWYDERRRGLGTDFYHAVATTVERIVETPEAGSPFAANARRMFVTGFPYQIVYRLEPNEIRIVAVAHLKRRPGFWRHRR